MCLIDEARTPLIISGPTPKGDEHEFDGLKPKVVQLIQKQRQAVNAMITEAKKKLGTEGADKETTAQVAWLCSAHTGACPRPSRSSSL